MEKVRDGSPGLYRVTGLMNDGSEVVEEYNTVMCRCVMYPTQRVNVTCSYCSVSDVSSVASYVSLSSASFKLLLHNVCVSVYMFACHGVSVCVSVYVCLCLSVCVGIVCNRSRSLYIRPSS